MCINGIARANAEPYRSGPHGETAERPEQPVTLPGTIAIPPCYATLDAATALGTITDAALAASCNALADKCA